MLFTPRSRLPILSAAFILLIATCFQIANGQAQEIGDGENDPVKLFDRGQDAHAKGDYKTAIQLYEAAIKLKPEFPEAEFQRAMALLAVNRADEAVEGFNRAVALRPDWPMAYAKFGAFLSFTGSFDRQAEPILRRAIELDDKNVDATVALAVLRQRAGDSNEAVKLIRAATLVKGATSHTWRRRAYIEYAAGDISAAVSSITRALDVEPKMPSMRYDRARFLL